MEVERFSCDLGDVLCKFKVVGTRFVMLVPDRGDATRWRVGEGGGDACIAPGVILPLAVFIVLVRCEVASALSSPPGIELGSA